jgi:hypothetical protein
MKRLLAVIVILSFSINLIFSQYGRYKESKYLIGFNLQFPRGLVPSTALTNSGQSIKSSFGFGFIFQRKLTQNINIFFDINAYNYKLFLASQGEDVQSIWTTAESATHLYDPGAPQVQYVNDLPADVYFDMQSTGIRLGAKYIFGKKRFKPWAGVAFGLYDWEVNYFEKGKDKTYGGGRGYVAGLTFLAGVDFKVTSDKIITAYADFGSPIAKYTIEGLFYPQWDLTDYQSYIMGPYRLGMTFSFAPRGSIRRK